MADSASSESVKSGDKSGGQEMSEAKSEDKSEGQNKSSREEPMDTSDTSSDDKVDKKSTGSKADVKKEAGSDGPATGKESVEKKLERIIEKKTDKATEKKTEKATEKKTEKAEQSAEKSAEKKTDKSSDKKSDAAKAESQDSKTSEKSSAKKSSGGTDKSEEKKDEKAGKSKTEKDGSEKSKSSKHESPKSSKHESPSKDSSKPDKKSSSSESNKENSAKKSDKEKVEKAARTEGTKIPEVKKEAGASEEASASVTKEGDIKQEVKKETEKMEVDAEESKIKDEEAEATMCYCLKERNLKVMELQCGFCLRFYHGDCITQYLGKCVPYMTNYQFFCKRCNPNGLESFSKKQPSFSQMCHTALANLTAHSDEKRFFSKEKEIIPYIDKNWESLTTSQRRIKLTWHTTIGKTLQKELDLFMLQEGCSPNDPHFGLADPDLTKIGPNYENLFKTAAGTSFLKSDLARLGGGFCDGKTRGTKRKAPGDGVAVPGLKQKRGEISSLTSVPHGYPMEHPFNKDGYRYILAEPDPHAPNRQAFDESTEMAGKPIPGYLYRTWLGNQVLLAAHDRAPQLKVSEDRLTVTGEKGYSMIRATHGVSRGQWYYEVKIMDMPDGTATRLGWSQPLGNLQAPCGYDRFSYSWRSKKGTCFHHSRGKHYSSDYKEGDTLGFFINLPEPDDASKLLGKTAKDKPLVKFKSHLYFEEKDYVTETEKKLTPLPGAQVVLYKNGQSQGVAWEGVNEGTYYPAASLYKHAAIRFNFGPRFRHVPKGLKNFRPLSEVANEAMVEHALSDIVFHIDHEGRQPEF